MIPNGLERAYIGQVAAQLQACQRLLGELQIDGLLIAAGSEVSRFREDQPYPFKVNPYFKAWLPLTDRPDCYLWIDSSATRPLLLYYQPQDIWHKVEALRDETVLRVFNVVVYSERVGLQRHLPISAGAVQAYIGAPEDCPLQQAKINPEKLLDALDYAGAVKSAYEQSCMHLANVKAAAGHMAAAQAFDGGGSEFDIQSAYLQASGQLEDELPYGNIIAVNEHAAVLHYTQKQRQVPLQQRSFLIDAGATVAGYAADISRTYAAPSYTASEPQFAELIVAMEQLQQQVIASIRVGDSYIDLHLQAHRLLAALLLQAGLVNCAADACVEQGLTSVFFPHGLGHLLGLQVHERGGWLQSAAGDTRPPPAAHPYLRLTRTIEAGQVFTIEPGLYFIPVLLQQARASHLGKLINWAQVEKLLGCGGIRIEDNIVVTADGTENLTRTALAAATESY